MKKILLIVSALALSLTAMAQETEAPKFSFKQTGFMSTPKVGAYIIGSYKYSDLEGANGGPGFGLRLIRAYVDGSIFNDFKYRVQFQAGGGTPHVKDYYIEWARWKEFSVKVGQFKRAFTFENPMNPWDVGVGDFSFLVQKFAGMVHYQLGVYNGQGINATDVNKAKDLIGTLQFQPLKGWYIGAFGWMGSWTNGSGVELKRQRVSFGTRFDMDNWTFRAEYAMAIAGEKQESGAADALYVTAGIPVLSWLKVYLKWDEFRSAATAATSHDMYSGALNFRLHKNLNFQLEYRHHINQLLPSPHYNEIWVQTYIRW